MKRAVSLGVVLSLSWASLAFHGGSALFAESRPEPRRPADGELLSARSNEHPIRLEAEDFEDLEFLAPLLAGKRIVQLGENTHGVHEYNAAKARIVRYLHQELGYDVLAFESSIYQCYDAGLTAETAPAASTLRGCAFGVWHTTEVADLFEYIRGSQAGDRPLQLAGFDVQPIGRNKEDRPQFLARVASRIDTDTAAEFLELDSNFLEIYAQGGKQRRAYFRAETGSRMAASYDRAIRFLVENRAALESLSPHREEVGIAIRVAASMASYIRYVSAPSNLEYSEGRDRGMAENLTYLLEDHYPGRKIIVWGHNFHLRHANDEIAPSDDVFPGVPARTMGSWIHERFGEEVYTVGLYTYQGQAVDNSGAPFQIDPAQPNTLEGMLHERGHEVLFVDFGSTVEPSTDAWFDQPTWSRFNATIPQELVPRDQYDAILFFDRVSPRKPLD